MISDEYIYNEISYHTGLQALWKRVKYSKGSRATLTTFENQIICINREHTHIKRKPKTNSENANVNYWL